MKRGFCARRCQGFCGECYPDEVGVEILYKMHFSLDAAYWPIPCLSDRSQVMELDRFGLYNSLRMAYSDLTRLVVGAIGLSIAITPLKGWLGGVMDSSEGVGVRMIYW